jgi:hypothetical protein
VTAGLEPRHGSPVGECEAELCVAFDHAVPVRIGGAERGGVAGRKTEDGGPGRAGVVVVVPVARSGCGDVQPRARVLVDRDEGVGRRARAAEIGCEFGECGSVATVRIAGVRLGAPVARLLSEILESEGYPDTAGKIARAIDMQVTVEAPLGAADYQAIAEALGRTCPPTLYRVRTQLLEWR